MSRTVRLILLAIAFTAALAAMAGLHLSQRERGQEIRLAMEPVDPRDLLLGHYVIVSTPAHRLDTGALAGADAFERGEEIWVELGLGEDGRHLPVALRRAQPAAPALRGRVRSSFTPFQPIEEREAELAPPAQIINAEFNVERYYAAPDDALALERMTQDARLAIILSVAPDGSAVIKGLEIDGEARYDRVIY